MSRHIPPHSLAINILLLAGWGAMVSCQSSSSRTSSRQLNTGLDQLMAQRDAESGRATPTPESARVDASDLQSRDSAEVLSLLEEAQRNSQLSLENAVPDSPSADAFEIGPPEEIVDTDAPSATPNRGPTVALDDLVGGGEPGALDQLAATPEASMMAGNTDPEPAPPPEERFERATQEIRAQLEDRARLSGAPAGELARLGALELVTGSSEPWPEAGDRLTVRESAQLEAWREFVRSAEQGLASADGIESLRGAAAELSQALDEWSTLSIAMAALCRRVEGFGLYDEIARFGETHRFLAGRPIKFLLYVELDHLTHAGAAREGVWGQEVNLTQDLRLYHMARGGDTLVWRLPDQPVTDFSRNRRRDFFLVQLIDLPSTLSVGGYQLKLAITDRGSGERAEAIIPIEIVAHAQALQDE